jgi:hypothetical protein
VFFIYLRTNSNFCPIRHKLIGFYSRDKSVYCAVRRGSLKKKSLSFVFRGLNYKTTFVIKGSILVSNYNIHYQIMNKVSIYGIRTRKKNLIFAAYSFPLIFASWCLPYKTPAVVSHHNWDFPLYFFSIWEISWWNFRLVYRRRLPSFQGEESKCDCRKLSFHDMIHSIALCGEIRTCTISLQFSAFSLHSFCRFF